MNWFRFVLAVSFSALSVSATHVSADKSWQRSSVELVQAKLNDLGYPAGSVDGAWGRKTSSALSLYCEEYEHDCSGGEETVIDLLTTDTDDSYLDIEMDFASAVWFENRIGYGAPKDRVDRYVGMTRREAVALVIKELRDYQDPFELPSWFYEMKPLGKILDTRNSVSCDMGYLKTSLQSSWINNLHMSKVPQFDRISTFWLDHFSVAYDDYVHPHAYAKHTNFVRGWQYLSFLDLLYLSLSDPALIVYLNNDKSDRNLPNENLAREFFELFSLGEGNYSENDVREFSRLLTGRAFNTADEAYEFMPERAINPTAKIFGKKYNTVRSLVNDLKNHSAYGEYILTKLFKEYISLDEMDKPTFRRLKSVLIKEESSILKLFEVIITDKAFWELDETYTLVKSPLEYFAGAARTLNYSGNLRFNHVYAPVVAAILSDFGQSIYDPTSVDGWPSGREWLQGQDLDRRSEEMSTLFLTPISLDYLAPFVTPFQAANTWDEISKSDLRQHELSKFYASAKQDQLLIENITVDAEVFNPKKYSRLNLIFKNVTFEEETFDQITVSFMATAKYGHDMVRHAQVWKENVSGGFLNGLGLESSGNYVPLKVRLPLSNDDHRYARLSLKQKKVSSRLIKASSVILSMPDRWGWRNWIDQLLEDSGGKIDVHNDMSLVRLFEPSKETLEDYRNNASIFQCKNLGRADVLMKSYFDYWKIMARSGDQRKIQAAIAEKKFDYEVLSKFAENLGKIWLNEEQLGENQRSHYLMPTAKEQDWQDVLKSVEYNLR